MTVGSFLAERRPTSRAAERHSQQTSSQQQQQGAGIAPFGLLQSTADRLTEQEEQNDTDEHSTEKDLLNVATDEHATEKDLLLHGTAP